MRQENGTDPSTKLIMTDTVVSELLLVQQLARRCETRWADLDQPFQRRAVDMRVVDRHSDSVQPDVLQLITKVVDPNVLRKLWRGVQDLAGLPLSEDGNLEAPNVIVDRASPIPVGIKDLGADRHGIAHLKKRIMVFVRARRALPAKLLTGSADPRRRAALLIR